MDDVNAAWDLFDGQSCQDHDAPAAFTPYRDAPVPKPTPIYISTRTRIARLKTGLGLASVDLKHCFWGLNVIDYWEQKEGIVKKQMKFVSTRAEDLEGILGRIDPQSINDQFVITSIRNPEGKIKFKDVRKITVGLSKKDITSYRSKQKGAFYNCFALVIRVWHISSFHEIHVKVFNTGKLEIPGVQNEDIFNKALDILCSALGACIPNLKDWSITDVSTVLINSNFSCGYYIDRVKLYARLRGHYRINTAYDPCSYPGIQCEFYYSTELDEHTGKQPSDEDARKYSKISFMIFRTGSVLIVGKCSEQSLQKVYGRLRQLLEDEYNNVKVPTTNLVTPPCAQHKSRSKKKRVITVSSRIKPS